MPAVLSNYRPISEKERSNILHFHNVCTECYLLIGYFLIRTQPIARYNFFSLLFPFQNFLIIIKHFQHLPFFPLSNPPLIPCYFPIHAFSQIITFLSGLLQLSFISSNPTCVSIGSSKITIFSTDVSKQFVFTCCYDFI